MTFISKIPQLFLKAFFGTFIMLFAFISIERHTGASGNSFLALLFLAFLLINPYRKSQEVYGYTSLTFKTKPFVFVGILVAVNLAVLVTLFLFAVLCSVFLPETINRTAFETSLDFFIKSHLLLAYALILYIVFVGLTRWFFATTTERPAEITHIDKWQKIFDFVLYIASILILVSDASFGWIIKLLFVVSFFIAVWQEKQNINEYF